MDTQVIVVGAGPVGLMLAGELRLGGAEVVVLERRDAPTTESRASTLHARTMEILDSRGLLAAFGTPPSEPRGHFGGIPLDLTLPGPYPGQWKVPQFRTEEVLQERALSLGADIRRGHELRTVSTAVDGEHVEAEAVGPDGPLLLRGRYLVACDGEDSTVRGLTGAAFPGRDAGRELLRADVDGIEVPNRRFERLAGGLAIAARRDDGVTRVMVHEFGSTARARTGAPEFTEIADVWKRVTGEDISTGTPLWANSFGDANRQLVRYRDGNVLYAGDAAHRQMPIGGQALNLGLQDAFNLGWKLALHLRGAAPATLLDSYHRERHAVGRRVLANIEAQALLLLGGAEVEPLRAVWTELVKLEAVREHLAGMISGLDVRYAVDGPPHPLLGARLPYTVPHPAAQALRAGRGVLLDPRRPTDTVPRGGDGWADRVTAVAAPAEPGGGQHRAAGTGGPDAPEGPDAVLVRPDGHVAWAGPGGDGLPQALERWFGPSL
nr:FAD-dependent monooxygenase [Streptomyces vietnamensis]